MTPTEKLITTARRYCMDNHSYWAKRYGDEMSHNNNPYSDNDYNLFPRYNVLDAILRGVETTVGQNFSSFDDCKQVLIDKGQNSHSIFTIESNDELHLLGESGKYSRTTGKRNPIATSAMLDERKKFIEFIQTQTIENISSVEPLPYRRKLKDDEAIQIRKRLLSTWNYDGSYWQPLDDKSPKPTVFVMKENITQDDIVKIIQFVSERADKKIFEISEDRNDYEIEINSFNPDLYETICCDQSFEWVVYGSHESTIAFGGTWLIEAVEKIFADRKEKLNLWEQN